MQLLQLSERFDFRWQRPSTLDSTATAQSWTIAHCASTNTHRPQTGTTRSAWWAPTTSTTSWLCRGTTTIMPSMATAAHASASSALSAPKTATAVVCWPICCKRSARPRLPPPPVPPSSRTSGKCALRNVFFCVCRGLWNKNSFSSPYRPACSCDDGIVGLFRCRDCNEVLCDNCVQAHQRVRITKDHYIVRISPPGSLPSPGDSPDSLRSVKHPLCTLLYYFSNLKRTKDVLLISSA